jgi:DNA-binding protein HU-beta
VAVNQSDLIKAVSQSTGMGQLQVERVMKSMVTTIQDAVRKGERVQIPGFLTFTRGERKASVRQSFGRTVKVAAAKVPKVSVGATFKSVVNGRSPAPAKAATKKAPAKSAGAKKAPVKKAAAKKR